MIEVISPSTEEVLAAVPSATAEDVDEAVRAARRAFEEGPWPRLDVAERIDLLSRVRDALAETSGTMAELITSELGSPITQSRVVQATMPVRIADAYMEAMASYPLQTVRRASTGTALVTREPVGVVAAVIPWNGPVAMCILKLFPALLAGCTAVLKPAPETPMSAYYVADLFDRAGLPAGVVNVLPAGVEASEYLVKHPGIDMITFTGSTSTGRRIAELGGRNLKRVMLELGGKSAAIILNDADLDNVVAALRMGSLRNNGQICSLKTRILVSREREEEVVERLVTMIGSMPVGDPWDPEIEIGPLVSERQRDRVVGYQEIGRAEGATAAVGGGGRLRSQDRGWYVEPTLFTGVKPEMRIAQEEIFGPVLAVLSYTDEEDAISIANNTAYGLNGAVFCGDVDHGFEVARQIRTGTVELNGHLAGLKAPAGGFKSSGIGREHGSEGLEHFLEPKSYGVPDGWVGLSDERLQSTTV
jgi:acyl-CoA reductase-like NAD-dependent aldehyde dehydrogenase